MAEQKQPIKREYVTYWSRADVILRGGLTLSQEKHFGDGGTVGIGKTTQPMKELLFPDSIPFRDLSSIFSYRKCKVTIEVIDE